MSQIRRMSHLEARRDRSPAVPNATSAGLVQSSNSSRAGQPASPANQQPTKKSQSGEKTQRSPAHRHALDIPLAHCPGHRFACVLECVGSNGLIRTCPHPHPPPRRRRPGGTQCINAEYSAQPQPTLLFHRQPQTVRKGASQRATSGHVAICASRWRAGEDALARTSREASVATGRRTIAWDCQWLSCAASPEHVECVFGSYQSCLMQESL